MKVLQLPLTAYSSCHPIRSVHERFSDISVFIVFLARPAAVSTLTISCPVFYSFPVRHAGQHYERLFLSKRNDHGFFLRGLGIISLSSKQVADLS